MGRSLWEGNLLNWSAKTISLLGLYCIVKSYFCRKSSMYGLVLYHLYGFMVVLYSNVSSIDVHVKFFKAETN